MASRGMSKRRTNRKEPTPLERALKDMLREEGIIVDTTKRFSYRTAKGRTRYIKPDLCIPAIKLAIEVDGPYHDKEETKKGDAKRDATIRSHGWKVIRLSNKIVYSTPKVRKVVEEINEQILALQPAMPEPKPDLVSIFISKPSSHEPNPVSPFTYKPSSHESKEHPVSAPLYPLEVSLSEKAFEGFMLITINYLLIAARVGSIILVASCLYVLGPMFTSPSLIRFFIFLALVILTIVWSKAFWVWIPLQGPYSMSFLRGIIIIPVVASMCAVIISLHLIIGLVFTLLSAITIGTWSITDFKGP